MGQWPRFVGSRLRGKLRRQAVLRVKAFVIASGRKPPAGGGGGSGGIITILFTRTVSKRVDGVYLRYCRREDSSRSKFDLRRAL